MYLQQAMDGVEYHQTKNPDVVFAYDKKEDAILFNPEHPMFSAYDFHTVMTHELGHRIDQYFVGSYRQADFVTAIQEGRTAIDANPELFVQFCRQNDADGFLSDVLDAISEGQYDFPIGHGSGYWNRETKARETFTNLFGLETFEDVQKLSFINEHFPYLMHSFRTLGFYI